MKKIIISLFLISLTIRLVGQTIYYDAKFLSKYVSSNKTHFSILRSDFDNTFDSQINEITKLISIEKDIAKINEYKKSLDELKKQLDDFNNKQRDTLYSVLKIYFPNLTPDDLIHSSVENLNKLNPFIKFSGTAKGGDPIPKQINLSSLSTSISGFNVTNFADGVAKFLVERLKDELSLAFFEKFKDNLNKSEYSDLQIMFPETWKTLNTIDKDIYNFNTYINTLRVVFIKDMTNGYLNVQTLLKQQKYQDLFQKVHPELGTIINTSFYFINKISTGMHPGEAFSKYDINIIKLAQEDLSIQNNIQNSIKTIQIISNSLRSLSKENYWVPSDSIKLLMDDEVTFKIYLGLIYQKVEGIKFINTKDNEPIYLQSILKKLADENVIDNLYQYKYFIESFADNAQELNENISSLRGKKKSEIDYNDYYKLFITSLNLIKYTSTFTDLPYMNAMINDKAINDIKKYTNNIVTVANATGELYVDIRTKNYSSAVVNSISILDVILNFNNAFNKDSLKLRYNNLKNNLDNELSKKENNISHCKRLKIYDEIEKIKFNNLGNLKIVWASIQDNIYLKKVLESIPETLRNKPEIQSGIISIIEQQRNIISAENKSAIRSLILKYGTFIASVAQADNSTDVKNAIEAIALPVGSYSIKQKSACNISLNGYMGYALDINNNKIYSNGVFAPVGFTGTVGLGKKHNWSLSVFTSIIDVGGLASYRLQNGSTDTLKQEVRLESIISPSLQIMVGIPKTPITLCAGWRSTPKLFYSGQKTFDAVASKSVFNVSILIIFQF